MCQGCYGTWTKLLDQWTDEFFPQTKVCVIKIEFFPFLPVLNILPVVVQASFYMDQDLIVYNGNKWSQGARFDGQTAVAAGWGRCFHFHCYHFHFYWHLAMFFAIFPFFCIPSGLHPSKSQRNRVHGSGKWNWKFLPRGVFYFYFD